MSDINLLVGFVILIAAAAFMALSIILPQKQTGRSLRVIPALENMRKAVYLSVEEGNRLHFSLGNSSLVNPTCSSAFVGLNALELLAQVSMLGDRPPVVTSGDGGLAILSRDTLGAIFQSGNAAPYDPLRSRLGGVTPISYVLGVIPILRSEKVATNILIGNYGPEVAFLGEVAGHKELYTLGASDSLTAQAVLFATANDILIGEEIYALPAYLQTGKPYNASVRTQDLLRWVLIVVMVGGSFARLVLSIVGWQ